MIYFIKNCITCLLLLTYSASFAQSKGEMSLINRRVKLIWQQTPNGWQVKTLAVRRGEKWINMENPSGENTLLYAAEKPPAKPDTTFKTITGVTFPEPSYKFKLSQWAESTNPVSLNTAGKAYHFFFQRR